MVAAGHQLTICMVAYLIEEAEFLEVVQKKPHDRSTWEVGDITERQERDKRHERFDFGNTDGV